MTSFHFYVVRYESTILLTVVAAGVVGGKCVVVALGVVIASGVVVYLEAVVTKVNTW